METNKSQTTNPAQFPCERCGSLEPELHYYPFGKSTIVDSPDPAKGQFICPTCCRMDAEGKDDAALHEPTKTASCTLNHPKDWPCSICNPQTTPPAREELLKAISDMVRLPETSPYYSESDRDAIRRAAWFLCRRLRLHEVDYGTGQEFL